MKDTFTTEELVAFGNYLLSQARTNLVVSHPELTEDDKVAALLVVSDADLSNFLEGISPVEI